MVVSQLVLAVEGAIQKEIAAWVQAKGAWEPGHEAFEAVSQAGQLVEAFQTHLWSKSTWRRRQLKSI